MGKNKGGELVLPEWYNGSTSDVSIIYPEWARAKNCALADGWWTRLGELVVLIRTDERLFEYRQAILLSHHHDLNIWKRKRYTHTLTYVKNHIEELIMEDIL